VISVDPPEPWPSAWWALCSSRELRSRRPLGVQRLGRRWVLWRDTDGQAHAAPAACPHRGTDLSLGRLREGKLECRYHGFQFASDGRCVAMPCEGAQAKVPPGLHMRVLPVQEVHGFVFVWLGEGEPTELLRLEESAASARSERFMTWPVRWSRVIEAMLDQHHFPFAHPWVAPPGVTRLDPYEAWFDEHGILRSRGELRREGAASGWPMQIDLAPPGLLRVSLGGSIVGIVVCTPIDAESTWIGIRYHVQVPVLGALPLVNWLAAEIAILSELWLVQPDDMRMVANAWPRSGGIEHEHLVHADKAIALWHAWRRRSCRGTLSEHGPRPVQTASP
jgi:phenylpropionate dioxygenase-like ring-hydroxylating dioxygenase large terminal subunit